MGDQDAEGSFPNKSYNSLPSFHSRTSIQTRNLLSQGGLSPGGRTLGHHKCAQ